VQPDLSVNLYDSLVIRQVNGVKLANILFSLLSLCLSVCVCAHSVLADICTLWAPSSIRHVSVEFYLHSQITTRTFSTGRQATNILWVLTLNSIGWNFRRPGRRPQKTSADLSKTWSKTWF